MKKLTNRDWVALVYVTLWIIGEIVTYFLTGGPEGPAYLSLIIIAVFLPILYSSFRSNKFKKWLDK